MATKSVPKIMGTMARAGLFRMVYPESKWVSPATILEIHASMISQHLIIPAKRTENIQSAIADLNDTGWYRFE